MIHALHVTTQGKRVGRLTFDAQDNQYSFNYARAWPSSPDSFYLAPAISLSSVPAASASVQRFLENLLPEGRALNIASLTSQISKNNVFGLVHDASFGGERAFPHDGGGTVESITPAGPACDPENRAEQAALDIYVSTEVDLVRQISQYIGAQAERLLGIADQIPKIDPNHFA